MKFLFVLKHHLIVDDLYTEQGILIVRAYSLSKVHWTVKSHHNSSNNISAGRTPCFFLCGPEPVQKVEDWFQSFCSSGSIAKSIISLMLSVVIPSLCVRVSLMLFGRVCWGPDNASNSQTFDSSCCVTKWHGVELTIHYSITAHSTLCVWVLMQQQSSVSHADATNEVRHLRHSNWIESWP